MSSSFLDEPKKEKQSLSARNDALRVRVGKTAMQGWRAAMEDHDVIVTNISDDPEFSICFVAIFDGHGGAAIAEAAKTVVLKHIRAHPGFPSAKTMHEMLAIVLDEAFQMADKELMDDAELGKSCEETGSTGVVALITPTHVVAANVGDSRCLLSSRAQQDVEVLSVDHKPDVEAEKQRILNAGGSVFRNRVCGGLALSRSFGDFWFKRNDKLKANEQMVTAVPHVHIQERQDSDEFLLLACDGIFDVMTNAQVRDFVRKLVASGVTEPAAICEQLVDKCLQLGSRDNMSAMLLFFDSETWSSWATNQFSRWSRSLSASLG